MTRKHLTVYLALGVVAGLFITACAGVATGRIDLPAAGDVLSVGPAVDAQSAPSIDFARPSNWAKFVFEKARPVQVESIEYNMESVRLETLSTARALQQALWQSQVQAQHEGFCNRGSP